MTFQGDNIIGNPTLSIIEVYIAEKGLFCSPQDVFDYWSKKEWRTKRGEEIKTLEAAINVYNSIAVSAYMKKNSKILGYTKLNRKEKRREKKRIRKALLTRVEKIEDLIIKEEKRKPKKKKEPYQKYADQLNDKRWKAFRDFVFVARGCNCEQCGATAILQVHHPKYIRGRKAWEYTCKEVMVVCKECHEKIHNLNN